MLIALSGCTTGAPAQSSDTRETAASTAASSSAQNTKAPELSSAQTPAAAIAGEDDPPAVKTRKPLTVMFDSIDREYTPFSADSDYDRFIGSVTGARLMETSRAGKVLLRGIAVQKERYNGNIYSYSGLSDTTLSYDEEKDVSVYTIKLREGVKFSDGEELDADDLIFSLYVLLDPAYSGSSVLADMRIEGLINYRFDNSAADTFTQEQINEALSSDEVKEIIKKKIIVPALTEQFATVETLYSDSTYDTYTKAYPRPEALFAFFYSLDSEYKPEAGFGQTKVIDDIANMYDGNYKLLGSMISGDEKTFEQAAETCAIGFLAKDTGKSGVSSISGIKKTGRYTVTVTALGKSSDLTRALADVIVAPLHYYGNESKYSYGASEFGFKKGEADKVMAKHAGEPLGAGAYSFVSCENGVVALKAFEEYYKGSPLTEMISVTTAGEGSPASAIAEGAADVAYCGGSVAEINEIGEINRSIKKIQLGTAQEYGYGYIGINAATVNIAGEPLSHASAMLRKAFAVSISYYKEDSVREHFGESVALTDVPSALGAVIQPKEPPYTSDAQGEPIFTDDMTDEEKYEALKNAVAGFLAEAGYTFEDGKVKTAPGGGKLEYNALLHGGGEGRHPAFGAFTKTAELFSELGMTLNIRDTADTELLWDELNTGKQELWAGAWNGTLRNICLSPWYGVNDPDLLTYLDAADSALTQDELSEACLECYELMTNIYAVDIPMYRRNSFMLFSSIRIDTSSMPLETTSGYDWSREIEKIKLK